MAWTRQILRAWSVLCLALVAYGTTPHVHHDGDESHLAPAAAETSAGFPAASFDPLGEATSGLSRDDAHESHSATASTEGHPCTLCRDEHERAAPFDAPLPSATSTALRIHLHEVAARAELLHARRHPARGPPSIC